MRPLISILRAAHCRSTHHYFAIDALSMTQTAAGARLGKLLLRYHDRYLAGAKDPDVLYRDFHNHVVHVTDGYWGGAPAKAMHWYQRLQTLLAAGRWAEAAHAMGVLSHYFTDPLQPLHTAQSEREKIVHRPLEWSITKSYESIRQQWLSADIEIRFELSREPGWLAEAILHGARIAHRAYNTLLDGYDLEVGVKDPPRGLDEASRVALAELFGLATVGLARVLDRAAEDAERQRGALLPPASMNLALLLASLRVPRRVLRRRLEERHEQEALEALWQEYQHSGKLDQHTPDEWQIVRRSVIVYQRERALRRAARAARAAGAKQDAAGSNQSSPQGHDAERLERQRQTAMQRAERAIRQAESQRDATRKQALKDDDLLPATIPFRPRPLPVGSRLSVRAAIVEAPSIGPKTAARFEAVGIETVGDLLDASPDATARRLAKRWIDAQRIADWQAQSQLMCSVPGLLSRDVQLLVGSGCRSQDKLASSDAQSLHKAILRFAVTSDGRRAMRGAEPPEKADIQRWIQNARPDHQAAA